MSTIIQEASKKQDVKERFLNLNRAGGKILGVTGVLLVGIPGGCWILERAGIRAAALGWILRGSLWAGAGLLLVLLMLVILEQWLDAQLFRNYRKTLGRRIPLGDGYAECPGCGFRRLRDFEPACPNCGRELVIQIPKESNE